MAWGDVASGPVVALLSGSHMRAVRKIARLGGAANIDETVSKTDV